MPRPTPDLTREQLRAIDRLAVERYHMPSIILMENAARSAADVADQMLQQRSGLALVLCGGGNNGGDGLAIARHLHNRGHRVQVALLSDPGHYSGDAKINLDIVRAMDLPAEPFEEAMIARLEPALIVDAIFGTGLDKPPRAPFEQQAAAINAANVPVLAVDVPSGLDCDTGRPLGGDAICASRTISFVAGKVGYRNAAALPFLGKLTIGDIGVPRALIDAVASGDDAV